MRYKHIAATMVAAGLLSLVGTGNAEASRRCGPTSEADGVGNMGTSWTLKSKHDDDGPGGSFVVGEEFEIHTNVPNQLWSITFADNGQVFFTGDDLSTATGIREQHPTANHPGTNQHMTVHAVNHTTGEIIDAAVDVAPVPACGG
ncbi:hypothetical protein ACFXPA_13545 [Amycolatopsis sp. NPDC059090]|uniref:hypothetical protein n=1 Tax=unclassified Amycolatopsis TaxID=2618356 RepID=UPI00366E2C6B